MISSIKKVVPVCVPHIGLSLSTERKLQCSSIFKVHWISSRLKQERTVARVWRWAWSVSSCAYTTNWNLLLNSCLLKAAHAVNTPSILPNQCAAVDQSHCCLLVLHSSHMGKTAGGLQTETNNLKGFKH